MKADEKVIHYIRKSLHDKYGDDYTALTQEQQEDLLLMVLNENLEQMRKENRRR